MHHLSFLEDLTHRVIPATLSLGLCQPVSALQARRQQYSFNSKHMFWHMISKEGLRSFYRGGRSLLLQTAALRTTFLAVYKACSGPIEQSGLFQSHPRAQVLATMTASALAHSLICGPLELVQTKMERARTCRGNLPSTFRAVVARIWGAEGARGFFRGTAATMLRDCASLGVLFSVYFQLCALWGRKGQTTRGRRFVSAGLAGVAGSIVSVPADAIRRRLQWSDSGPRVRAFDDFRIVRALARLGSVARRGQVCKVIAKNSVQAFLGTAMVFWAWELCQENLRFE